MQYFYIIMSLYMSYRCLLATILLELNTFLHNSIVQTSVQILAFIIIINIQTKVAYNVTSRWIWASTPNNISIRIAVWLRTWKTCLVQEMIMDKNVFIYSAVSSLLDRSKCFTLFLPWQTCSLRHQLDCSGKHTSILAMLQLRAKTIHLHFHCCL